MYDRLRWRRKNGSEAGVREILLNPPDELRRPELWWREQDKAIRAALAERSFKLAYRLASASRQKSGSPLRRGGVAGRLAGAAVHRPAEGRTPAFRAAVAGRGDADQPGPRRLLVGPGRRRRRRHPMQRPPGTSALPPIPTASTASSRRPSSGRDPIRPHTGSSVRPRRRRETLCSGAPRRSLAALFCRSGQARYAQPFFRHLGYEAADDPHELAAVVELAQGCGRADLVLAATRGAAGNGTHLVRESYPAAADRRRSVAITTAWPEPALVLAVARQESLFDPVARSSAGCHGADAAHAGNGADGVARARRGLYARAG